MTITEDLSIVAPRRSVSRSCKPHDAVRRIAAALAIAALLGGCGTVQVKESALAGGSLKEQIAPIVVGQSNRASVRAQLGTPWVASESWSFDLFRSTDQISEIFVVMLIPSMYTSEDVHGYVLVSYDDHGTVTAFDYGVTREGDWMLNPNYAGSLQLRAGDVTFWATRSEKSVLINVSASRGVDYVRHGATTGRCRVLVGSDASCGLKTALDQGDAIVLPAASLSSVMPFDLAPGTHEFKFESAGLNCSYEQVAQVQCEAGETYYVAAKTNPAPLDGKRHLQWTYLIDVQTTSEEPELLSNYGLLVYANGRWLAPDGPQH